MKKSSLFLCVCLAVPSGQAVPIVIGYGSGNSANGAPFGISAPFTMRYQQVYSSTIFHQIDLGGGWITTLAFAFEPPGPEFGFGFITELQIDLSTTSRFPGGLSTTFSENVGLDNTVVLGPRRTFFSQWGEGDTGLPVALTLDHPFYYNPTQGNLLMDVRVIRQEETGLGLFDATSGSGDAMSRIYGDTVDSLTGTADSYGLDTAFVITPVPEPGSVLLLLLGLPAVCFIVYRNHNTQTKDRRERQSDLGRADHWRPA